MVYQVSTLSHYQPHHNRSPIPLAILEDQRGPPFLSRQQKFQVIPKVSGQTMLAWSGSNHLEITNNCIRNAEWLHHHWPLIKRLVEPRVLGLHRWSAFSVDTRVVMGSTNNVTGITCTAGRHLFSACTWKRFPQQSWIPDSGSTASHSPIHLSIVGKRLPSNPCCEYGTTWSCDV